LALAVLQIGGLSGDSFWIIIGAIATVVSVIVFILVSLRQNVRKEVSYEELSNTSLVRKEVMKSDKLEIKYDGRLVEAVNLINLRITNSGNQPITKADYEQPITVNLGDQSEILDVEITKRNPKTLSPALRPSSKNLEIEPCLLNPKDSVTLKMLVSKAGKLTVNARIAGVKEIRNATDIESTSVWEFATQTVVLTAISIALFIGIFYSSIVQGGQTTTTVLYPVAILASVMIGMVLIFIDRARKSLRRIQ